MIHSITGILFVFPGLVRDLQYQFECRYILCNCLYSCKVKLQVRGKMTTRDICAMIRVPRTDSITTKIWLVRGTHGICTRENFGTLLQAYGRLRNTVNYRHSITYPASRRPLLSPPHLRHCGLPICCVARASVPGQLRNGTPETAVEQQW